MAKKISCIILAAGLSTRMGTQKLLLPVTGNIPMLRLVALTALASCVHQVWAVINPDFPEIADVLSDLNVGLIPNAAATKGMSTSFQCGMATLADSGVQAGIFLLGDQPGIEPWMINQVLDAYQNRPTKIVQASFLQVPGHPVLFDAAVFSEATFVEGDEGGRRFIAHHLQERLLVEMGVNAPPDMDTPIDYECYLQHASTHTSAKGAD